MKSLISTSFACIYLLVPSPGSAFENAEEACAFFGNVAAWVMNARQTNYPIVEVIEFLNMFDDEHSRDVAVVMVEEVYAMPKFSNPEHQEEIIQQYSQDWIRYCLTIRQD